MRFDVRYKIIVAIVLVCCFTEGCVKQNAQSSAQTSHKEQASTDTLQQNLNQPQKSNQTTDKEVDSTELDKFETNLVPDNERFPVPEKLLKQMLGEHKELRQCLKQDYENNLAEFSDPIVAEAQDVNDDKVNDFIVSVENRCSGHNSPTYVYQSVGGNYKFLLHVISNGVRLNNTKVGGFHDLYVSSYGGAYISGIDIYSFINGRYQPTKCYDFRPDDFKADRIKILVKPRNCANPS